jgi:hypothetical protein
VIEPPKGDITPLRERPISNHPTSTAIHFKITSHRVRFLSNKAHRTTLSFPNERQLDRVCRLPGNLRREKLQTGDSVQGLGSAGTFSDCSHSDRISWKAVAFPIRRREWSRAINAVETGREEEGACIGVLHDPPPIFSPRITRLSPVLTRSVFLALRISRVLGDHGPAKLVLCEPRAVAMRRDREKSRSFFCVSKAVEDI